MRSCSRRPACPPPCRRSSGASSAPPATRTIVFYAHYDGQPVTPSEWDTGEPFTPVIKQVNGEPRIYARGAGDDKAAIFAQLQALSALQAAHVLLKANIRFGVWEGEGRLRPPGADAHGQPRAHLRRRLAGV